jgi:methylated-DNA-[protein]-cysteine S-methyltransferase
MCHAAARNVRATGDTGQVTEFSWAQLDTPVGVVAVGCSAIGVAQVRFSPPPRATLTEPADGIRAKLDDATPGESTTRTRAQAAVRTPGELAQVARDQLAQYFRGERDDFDLPLDWSATSGTQRHVLEVLAESVKYGRTTSYGGLATASGLTASDHLIPARAVGKIMGSNPIPVIVPCHRVLASDGLGPEVKRWLLILEGSLPPTLDWQPATS